MVRRTDHAHYRLVGVCGPETETYRRRMSTEDAETLTELIRDCADIPRPPRPAASQAHRTADPWRVDSACTAQVETMDDYGT
ncbi:hypothetical protein GTS_20330 [Gandjariella thermophila]|uniref:Uncharacterized protein n=2 Tax=Gandjariella thermophila TaxID=1931992 RepID=A0A4D4J5N8_9PSEU|nr:hypothetical protein GTS_20330 [Gandjariella thermophila]